MEILKCVCGEEYVIESQKYYCADGNRHTDCHNCMSELRIQDKGVMRERRRVVVDIACLSCDDYTTNKYIGGRSYNACHYWGCTIRPEMSIWKKAKKEVPRCHRDREGEK